MAEPGFQVTIVLEGEKVLSRRLLNAQYAFKSLHAPFETINTELQKTFQMNFSTQGSLFGGWAERKPQYKNGERVDTWPLLNKTGNMKDSFDGVATDSQLVIFNTAPYFKYHQSKAERSSNLPRRVMIGLDKQRKEFVIKTFQQYISRTIGR